MQHRSTLARPGMALLLIMTAGILIWGMSYSSHNQGLVHNPSRCTDSWDLMPDILGRVQTRNAGMTIWWLHIPKTGTSFGNVLVTTLCKLPPGVYVGPPLHGIKPLPIPINCLNHFMHFSSENQKLHDHIRLPDDFPDYKHVVTVVRDPVSRVKSHLNHILTFKYHQQHNKTLQLLQQHPLNCSAFRHEVPILDFGVEMIVRNLNSKKACLAIRTFAFVGIFEFWEASMCLFHFSFGGQMSASDFVNVRKSVYSKAMAPTIEQVAQCQQEAEMTMYKCAIHEFFTRLSRSNCTHYVTQNHLASF
jgi:hypothetical protein